MFQKSNFQIIHKVFGMILTASLLLARFGFDKAPIVRAQEAGTATPITPSIVIPTKEPSKTSDDAKGLRLELTSTIPIPAEIWASVLETLRSRPVDILPGDRLIITSLDQDSGWALMTVAVRPENPNAEESILLNSSVVIANSSAGIWTSAIMGTDTYEVLLAEAPTALVPAESRSFMSTKSTDSSSQAIGTSLRWPWASNSRWTMTQGPHSWYGGTTQADRSAIDFASLDGNIGVYAAAPGTIVRRCEDDIQREIVIRNSTGTGSDDVTGYLHIDKNSSNTPALGSFVNSGAYIGNYYNNAIAKQANRCGWGTGGHLHFWIATIPTSSSSTAISSFSLSNMYGQTISGWQMQSNNCFTNGSQRPLCPRDPIPGDGSAPGPRPPSNLSATPASSSQINLSWSGSPDSVDGYRVWSGGAIVANQVTATSYSFSGLNSCSTYSFYITAYKGDLPSSASNTASAKTSGCLSGAPSAPSLNSPSNGQVFPRFGDINLVWNSNGSYRYLVEFWGGPDGGKSNLGWQSGTSLFFGNGNWGGYYSWHVKAQNSSGQSSDWGETRTFFKKYGTPGSVGVSALSDTQARLTWSASADAPGNIEGYKIYRDGQLRAVTGSGSSSFDDYDLNCNTSYSYYLTAFKGGDQSDQSNTVSMTTNGCPPPAPSANFDAWPQSGNPPLTVALHIVDMSNITNCSWNYGDGQTSTTCTQLHNHIYANAGLYTVGLSVSGPGGSDSMTLTNYINVSVISPPSGNFNNFSTYTPGIAPAGWLLRGTDGITPTIEEVGGSGADYRLVSFPEVSWQYWDKWLLKSGTPLSSNYSVTVKMNFQNNVADRAGLTIAWDDSNWNRIDIQPNVYADNIEFRVNYVGSLPSSVNVTNIGYIPINASTDYWLRAEAMDYGPGQCQVKVYWSTDGINFTQVITATGLATVTGLTGISTAGPHMPHTHFDDFSIISGDNFESDNISTNAKMIISSTQQTHSIIPATDVDWVKFQLTSTSAVTLETTGATSSDTRMWLYDSNLAEIEYDDDDGIDNYSLIDRLCNVDSLPDGTYYVKVDEYGNNNEIQTYNLALTVQNCSASSNVNNLFLPLILR